MYSNTLNNWFYGEDVQVDDMKLLTKSFLQLCFAANGGNVMVTGITPTITGSNIATTKGFVYFGETSDAIFIERTGTNQLLSFVNPTSVSLITDGYLYVKPNITYDANNRTSTVSGVVYTSTNAANEGINLATITNGVITQINSINPLGATQLQRGIIQLATQAEVNTGTISNKAVVPSTLAQLLTLYAKLSANNAFTGINTVLTQLVTDTTTKIANMAAINQAVTGYTGMDVSTAVGGVLTVTDAQYRLQWLYFSGTLTSDLIIDIPSGFGKTLMIQNAITQSGFTVSLRRVGYTNTVILPSGNTQWLFNAASGLPMLNAIYNAALTGTPTAPTAPFGTNTTQLATCAFVQASGLGINQTWQDITASRAAEVTYTNTTGKAIMVIVTRSVVKNFTAYFTVNGIDLIWGHAGDATGIADAFSIIIPVGTAYKCNTFSTWAELR